MKINMSMQTQQEYYEEKWEVSQLLFADDMVVHGGGQQEEVGEFR